MAIIKSLIDRIERIKTIYEKKNADYAQHAPFENFERSAEIAGWFDDPIDKAFAVLIGTKLARIATLRNKKSQPNNESLADSFDDLPTYCLLWGSFVEQQEIAKLTEQPFDQKIPFCYICMNQNTHLIKDAFDRYYCLKHQNRGTFNAGQIVSIPTD